MDLIPHIYHERQDPGSMLCAQHALNNLMQSHIWTANDLAEIAHRLDSIEDSHLDAQTRAQRQGQSANYDDSGFFSVQVIDDALHQLGLRLVRWQSDEMKPMHAYPENQEAFILNHDLHWFTLRRFGGNADRWYDLNSVTGKPPTWIGSGFLSMTISQAEAEGYSIFAVAPVAASSDPTAPQPGTLMACEADEQAQSLNPLLYSPPAGSSSASSTTNRRRRADEDMADDEQPRQRARVADNQLQNLSEAEQLRLAIEASLLTNPERASSNDRHDSDDEAQGFEDGHGSNSFGRDQPNPSLFSHAAPAVDHNPDFESQLEAAIRASLEESGSDGPSDSTPDLSLSGLPSSHPQTDGNWDEPTAEELRLRRLARFG
ncbi:Josephin-domain-containing protein [Melampsora americana]|nr:Josephin-domain-containing protein [Melampsora americana]